jgi:hypothetical protein
MKQRYFPLKFWLLPGVLLILVLCVTVSVPAQAPSIEGTYQLVSRKLPDGTMQSPPDIIGLLTYAKSHRNFNILWKDAQGKLFSYSLVSTYNLTPAEYSETILFSILNDQIGGKDIVYDLSRPTQTAPVKVEGGRLQFKLPFDPPAVVFEGGKMTATAEGRFVDVWEKVP